MGWAHDQDLFGGREFGHSDQVTFLILSVRSLLLGEYLELLQSGGVRGIAAPGRQVSIKRPDAGVVLVVSDLLRRGVRFSQSNSKACAPSGHLIGLS